MGNPSGGPRGRRPRLAQTRALVSVCAQGDAGLGQLAESCLRLGGKRTEVPPGSGTRQDILATDRLTRRRYL